VRLGHVLLREKRFVEADAESRAGLDILTKKSGSSVTWIQTARDDLAAEHDSLQHPVLAASAREGSKR
jgi:hypothetical protein